MNKTLIAAAIAGIAATPLAMADDSSSVTIYGKIEAGVEAVSATGAANGVTNYSGRSRLTSNTTKLGFKGYEDLGDGMKAVWQVEQRIAIDGSSNGPNDTTATKSDNGFANRNSFVGLDNAKLGKFLIGRFDNAYKAYINTVPGIDVFTDESAGTTGQGAIFGRSGTRLNNSIGYYSPDFNGYNFAWTYSFDEAKSSTTTISAANPVGDNENQYRTSLAGRYKGNGLVAAIAYEYRGPLPTVQTLAGLNTSGNNNTAVLNGTNHTNSLAASASYQIQDTTVAAGYEWIQAAYKSYAVNVNTSNFNLTQQDFTVALTQRFGALAITASYSQLLSLNGYNSNVSNTYQDSDFKANEAMLGAMYDLSKRTQILAYYAKINNGNAAMVDFESNALNSNLQNGNATVTNANANFGLGANPQVFGVALRHAF